MSYPYISVVPVIDWCVESPCRPTLYSRYHMYAAEGKRRQGNTSKPVKAAQSSMEDMIEVWIKEDPAQRFFYRRVSKKVR